MSEEHILKQINLLNPKVKNKEVGDIEISEATSSDEINYNALQFNNNFNNNNNNNGIFNNRVILNEEDNGVLNLWSQTNFFFDPVDSSKIDAIQQQQQPPPPQQNDINTQLTEVQNGDGGENNNEILQLSERERDRQRYNKIREKIYSHKTKHPKENDSNPTVIDKNTLNKEDFLDFNGLQHLLGNSNSNKSDFQFDTNILNISNSDTNPNFSAVGSSSSNSFSNNNVSSLNNQNKSSNKSKGGKNNLYTQILNSINNNTNIHSNKEINSSSFLSKTNDSRNKEIADKKKRRSAATMRCREKKRNQFQKKEQYINYLKNHVLFLDGLISHMGNEINWLRKSYITQHGEQSLKEVYIENGLKNVDFNVFPGSVSLTSSSLLVNPLNQDSTLKPPSSSTLPFNPTNIIPTPSLSLNKNDESSKLANIPLGINSPSIINANPSNVLDLNINNNSFNASSLTNIATSTAPKEILQTSSQSVPTPSINSTKPPDSTDNMSFLNGFLNLSKEQRDLLINFLKKQDQVQKPSNPDPVTSFSKTDSLLSTIHNTTAATTTSATSFSLQQNLLNSLNQQSNLQSINFNNTTTTMASTQPTTEGNLSNPNLSNPAAPTTTSIQNLDKMVYYI